MPATTVASAALDRAAATTTPAPALSLEARMAAVDAAMEVRLQEASIAHDVNTAHIDTTPLDLADVIRGPVDTSRPPVDLYPTPVANLLQRAHQRLIDDDWCSGALVNEQGARCLMGAIRVEAGSRSVETEGLDVLMDAIRSQFPTATSVPSFNDAWADARMPLRLLQQAADRADVLGI